MSHSDPSDEGAPPGAPKPSPVPQELIEEAYRTFDPAEIDEALRMMREGEGLTFEQCMEELNALLAKLDDAA